MRTPPTPPLTPVPTPENAAQQAAPLEREAWEELMDEDEGDCCGGCGHKPR